MPLLNFSSKPKPTQVFVPIKEVRDGVVILKDGSFRSIMMSSSMNFALKSEDEQRAIIAQFQNFLNSLDFSVQIFVQSRRLDIRPYLALLEERYKEQVNELMKIQTREYIEFVKNFTESSNIMTKTFFMIIPYSPAILQGKNNPVAGLIPGRKKASVEETAKSRAEEFEEARQQIEERTAIVDQGLTRCGLRTIPLGTEEVVELFYKIFNPGEMEKPIQLN